MTSFHLIVNKNGGIAEFLIIFASYFGSFYDFRRKRLKGNQVKILNSPAAVSSLKRFEHHFCHWFLQWVVTVSDLKLMTANCKLILGRRSNTGVSQKTCQASFFLAFEERAEERDWLSRKLLTPLFVIGLDFVHSFFFILFWFSRKL